MQIKIVYRIPKSDEIKPTSQVIDLNDTRLKLVQAMAKDAARRASKNSMRQSARKRILQASKKKK